MASLCSDRAKTIADDGAVVRMIKQLRNKEIVIVIRKLRSRLNYKIISIRGKSRIRAEYEWNTRQKAREEKLPSRRQVAWPMNPVGPQTLLHTLNNPRISFDSSSELCEQTSRPFVCDPIREDKVGGDPSR